MKRIDFIMAGIVSAVWAILTCMYCGMGYTIDSINQFKLGAGWYLPLPSRYWDWLYIGAFYIVTVSVLRGHWLPNRKHKSYDLFFDMIASLGAFVIILLVLVGVFVTKKITYYVSDFLVLMTLACIGTRRDNSMIMTQSTIAVTSFISAANFGWYLASLSLLIILVAKILIWLVVNSFRSGFSTARRQLWMSLVLGKNPFDEGGSDNVPPNTVALAGHTNHRQEAEAQ